MGQFTVSYASFLLSRSQDICHTDLKLGLDVSDVQSLSLTINYLHHEFILVTEIIELFAKCG